MRAGRVAFDEQIHETQRRRHERRGLVAISSRNSVRCVASPLAARREENFKSAGSSRDAKARAIFSSASAGTSDAFSSAFASRVDASGSALALGANPPWPPPPCACDAPTQYSCAPGKPPLDGAPSRASPPPPPPRAAPPDPPLPPPAKPLGSPPIASMSVKFSTGTSERRSAPTRSPSSTSMTCSSSSSSSSSCSSSEE
eukprot:26023-Pelagococcus_subviridis.AAC.6